MRSAPTLEQLDRLWSTLGLDSLAGDVSPDGLTSTRARDWEEATVRAGDPATRPPVPTERDDLPALSLTPPTLGGREDPAVLHRDLRVTGLLGEGGMGRVLLAHQGSLGRDVAVKVPRANATPGALNALLHEAQTTGALEHPGVIPVYSLASDDDGKPALVMKRVDGVSWSMLLRHADDPAWSRVPTQGERIDAHVELLRQVCNAIAYAHRKGVLHRDLKPSNVLIGEFGEVYVADWGIATRKPQPGEHRKPGLVGTPVYMAPEMVTGDDAQMDERTDVFLLGATLYELLTGTPPWAGADLRAVLECAWQCKPKAPPESAPAELVGICRKAMAPEPAHRYQSALEFRDALGGFLRHRGSVKLASLTSERLVALLATLETTADAQVYPLLSECRFGFTMALREWPENEVAREGLARCLVATAQYELRRGNLAAVRALLAELEVVPAELKAELARREAQAASREARLEHLTQEMDPAVAFRQRVLTFLATMVGIAAVVFLPQLVPSIHAAREGRWYLTTMLVVVMSFFAVGVWFGRAELLSTRLNRRLIGLVAVAGLGTLAQRALFALFEVSARQTVLHNFLFVTALAITGGLTLHSGFFWSALAMVVGLAAAIVLPGIDGELFGVAAAAALGVAVLSWRRWRGEFSIERGE